MHPASAQIRTAFYRRSVPRNALAVLALAVLTFLVFGQSLHYGFIEFDDDLFVKNNPALTQGLSENGLRWAFTANFLKVTPGAEYWEPLTLISRLADWQFYQFDAAKYHRTSVCIHLLAGLALLGLLQTLTRRFWESLLVSALFLIHPMHVEPVCWLSARKDLVSGLFYILALWSYAFYGKKPSAARYGLLLMGFAAANMAKPMAVSLPFLFAFLDFWPLGRWHSTPDQPRWPVWKLLLEKVPLLAMAAFVSAMAYITQKGIGAVVDDDLLPLSWRLGNAALSTGIYFCKAFVPIHLTLLYPHPGRSLNIPLAVLSACLLLLLATLVYRLRRERPWLMVGLLWFIFVLGPVIGIIQVGEQAMADRYSYLAFIGLFIAVIWELSARLSVLPSRSRHWLAWASALSVVGVFSGLAFVQTQTWQSSLAAFSHAVAVTDNNFAMQFNLGTELMKAGQRDAGRRHLDEAIRVRAPHNAYLLQKAGEEIAAGQLDSAAYRIGRVLAIMPWNSDLHMQLAEVHRRNGQPARAREEWHAALRYHPLWMAPRLALAKDQMENHAYTEARQTVADALAIEPANADLLALQKTLQQTATPSH